MPIEIGNIWRRKIGTFTLDQRCSYFGNERVHVSNIGISELNRLIVVASGGPNGFEPIHDNFRPVRRDKFLVGEINDFFRDRPKVFGGEPETDGRATQYQSKKSGERFAISFEKTARTGSPDSKQAKDEGNTFFRLVAGTAVIGLVYALLKRIGKKDYGAREGHNEKGDNP